MCIRVSVLSLSSPCASLSYLSLLLCLQTCANKQCGKTLSKYYRGVCNLWDNDPTKKIYHCHDCGLCRIGEGLGMLVLARVCFSLLLRYRMCALFGSAPLSHFLSNPGGLLSIRLTT